MIERIGVLLALVEDVGEAMLKSEATGIILLALTWTLIGLMIGAQIA